MMLLCCGGQGKKSLELTGNTLERLDNILEDLYLAHTGSQHLPAIVKYPSTVAWPAHIGFVHTVIIMKM